MNNQQPNILFILLDDLGYRDLSCYGSDFYETPNLDKLAANSLKFTNAYAASPVCSPTRGSILTGKSPARISMTQWLGGTSQGRLFDVPAIDHLQTNHTTLATALKNAGYATWHVGKWHLSTHDENRFDYYPDKHGFDINIGGCDWGHPFNGYFSPYNIETLENGPEGEYLTDRLTDEAIDLIKGEHEKPWFMHLSHYAVHTPIQCHEALVEKYRKKAERLGRSESNAFKVGEHFPCDHKRDERVVRRVVQSDPVYAAMIENLDWNIGRTLDALEESGQLDNTLVVFFSDNGGLATSEGSPTCNAPLAEGKGWLTDGGIREPLIVSWPKVITQGKVLDSPVISMDFFPTFLQCAGLELMPEHHMDGMSFLPLLEGAEDKDFERGPLFWQYPHYSNQGGCPSVAVREGEWKLVYFYEDESIKLFNLVADISETTDLSQEQPQIASQLLEKLKVWEKEVEAAIPEKNPDFVDIRKLY